MNGLYIALGGALGALSRYWLSATIARLMPAHFPWGTLSINVLGSFAIGVLWIVFAQQQLGSESSRLFWMTGFLGGFTTFSSFSLESLLLLQQERWLSFGLYAGGSLCVCLLAAALGMALARQFV